MGIFSFLVWVIAWNRLDIFRNIYIFYFVMMVVVNTLNWFLTHEDLLVFFLTVAHEGLDENMVKIDDVGLNFLELFGSCVVFLEQF